MIESKRISINLPHNLIINTKEFAKKTGRTISGTIKCALEKFMHDDEENMEFNEEFKKRSEEAMKELREGKMKTVPVDEVFKQCGL